MRESSAGSGILSTRSVISMPDPVTTSSSPARVEDGTHYVLNGAKCFIGNASRADFILVEATLDRSDGHRRGHRSNPAPDHGTKPGGLSTRQEGVGRMMSFGTFGDVAVDLDDDFVATLEINRPPENIFDRALIASLSDALDADPRCRASVLCSSGKHFCAGADFRGRPLDTENGRHLYDEVVPNLHAKPRRASARNKSDCKRPQTFAKGSPQ